LTPREAIVYDRGSLTEPHEGRATLRTTATGTTIRRFADPTMDRPIV
jgi:hypothetical protein